MKLAQSGTKEGITRLVNQYFYSTEKTVNFETGEIIGSKGISDYFRVVSKKGRYIFESID